MVKWVRRKIHYGGMIDKPITFGPNKYFSDIQSETCMKGYTFTSFPIVDENNKLLGMITRDEMDFVQDTKNPLLSTIMKKREAIVTSKEGTDSIAAYQLMKSKKVKKLPVVDDNDVLLGMYVWNDVKDDQRKRQRFSLDKDGHFLVGAAIGVGPSDLERADLLVKAGCRVIVLDSSHGACKPVVTQIAALRQKYGDTIDIIAGNIASYDSAIYLLSQQFKPDALKVGIGPGSICTTRQVTGHGIPQVTAIFQVYRAVQDYGKKNNYYVPIIADGGIKTSGDIVKSLASGASAVMLGSMLAGTLESPGQVIMKGGRRYKTIRGMGSRSAMEQRSGSRGRYYRQSNEHATEQLTKGQQEKLVPEGVEGLVEFKGTIEKVLTALIGGVQAGLSHSGAANVTDFRQSATCWLQSNAGVNEGRPHSITDIRH